MCYSFQEIKSVGSLETSRQELFILSVFLLCSLKSTRNYSIDLKVETLDRNRESYFASIKMVSYMQRSFKHHVKAEINNAFHKYWN